jgi:hypothetical protein
MNTPTSVDTDQPTTPPPDPAGPANRLRQLLVAGDIAALTADDEVDRELGELLEAAPDGQEFTDRATLLAMADRVAAALARDEAELEAVTLAARKEVELISSRYERLGRSIAQRTVWKRQTLTAIAEQLHPDAKAKVKSINLPMVTLGRTDFAESYALVDEEAALARARVTNPEYVGVVIDTTLAHLEGHLEAAVIYADEQLHVKGGRKLTLREIARMILRTWLEMPEGQKGWKLGLGLKWGQLKRNPAACELMTLERDGKPGGVSKNPARVEFYANLVEG